MLVANPANLFDDVIFHNFSLPSACSGVQIAGIAYPSSRQTASSRNQLSFCELARQLAGGIVEVKKRDTFQFRKSSRGSRLIPARSLADYEFGNVKVETMAVNIPPFSCQFLMRCDGQIATWPRRQITRDRCFQITLRFTLPTFLWLLRPTYADHYMECLAQQCFEF